MVITILLILLIAFTIAGYLADKNRTYTGKRLVSLLVMFFLLLLSKAHHTSFPESLTSVFGIIALLFGVLSLYYAAQENKEHSGKPDSHTPASQNPLPVNVTIPLICAGVALFYSGKILLYLFMSDSPLLPPFPTVPKMLFFYFCTYEPLLLILVLWFCVRHKTSSHQVPTNANMSKDIP